jgi:hypothetical protein
MVEYSWWLISLKRFGLYNTQLDKLFNWVHGNQASGVRGVMNLRKKR